MAAESDSDRRRFSGRVCCVLALLLSPFWVGLVVLQIDYLHQQLCQVERAAGAGEPAEVEVAAPSLCHVLLQRSETSAPVEKGDLLVCHAPELACGAAMDCPVLPALVMVSIVEWALLLGALVGRCFRPEKALAAPSTGDVGADP